MKKSVAKYRKYLGYTQSDMANIFNISLQAYSRKERGINAFNDEEKMIIKDLLLEHFPGITIDEIFLLKKCLKLKMRRSETWPN